MQCRNVLTRIDALRTGELTHEEQKKVRQHMSECPSCDDSLGDVDHLAALGKDLLLQPPRSCRTALRARTVDQIDSVETPRGTLWVAFSDRGLRMMRLGGTRQKFIDEYRARFDREVESGELPDPLRRQVIGAVAGEAIDKTKLELEETTPLEEKVLDTLQQIPRGEVRTYAWLAAQVGHPRAVRAVGNIVARNVMPFVVPCHRIVPTTGGVGNYLFGTEIKRELLRSEGVDIETLDDLARKGIRYIGSRTTRIFCFPTCRDARRIREENQVPFHDSTEARESGFRPCLRCKPVAA